MSKINLVHARLEAGRASLNQPRRDAYIRLLKRLADRDADVASRVLIRVYHRLPDRYGQKSASRYIQSAMIRQGRPLNLRADETRRGDLIVSKGASGSVTILHKDIVLSPITKLLVDWVSESGERGVWRISPSSRLKIIRPPHGAVLPAMIKPPAPPATFARKSREEINRLFAFWKKPLEKNGTLEKAEIQT